MLILRNNANTNTNKFSVYIKASHFRSISCVHVCVNVLNREGVCVCVRACMRVCV